MCVSHNFHVKTLLKDILESLTRKKYEIQSRDIIVGDLEKELGGKKFLLMLDDVWSEDSEAWDSFRSCLLGISTTVGNKIVVTTRSTRVASVIKTHPTYNLEGLTAGGCWSMFKERAFGPGGASMTPELMDIGFEIAKKCSGVPLAAKLIGSMMRSKERHDWVSIKDQGFWGLGGEEDGVSRILKLSFDHLPSSFLKQCFSYCSIFPKDCDIDKEQLIQLWMAVGFLQTNHKISKSMEDIGEEFFRFLVQSSLLQDVKKDSYNHLTGCRMHDLVHDLSLSVSESEIFHSDATPGNGDIFKARHLALYSDGEIISKISKERARYLHTLFSSIKVDKNILSRFKCLRVLNFSGADIEELPNFISMLVHLRYLDLSDTNIKVLPYGISKLYNLQTLRLNYCRHLELQDELKNLISLRHLHISEYRYKKMPLEIGRLTCLRTLKFFNVGEENGRRTEELGSLINLSGKLKLNFLDRVNGAEEARRAKLFEKADIYKLEFKWSSRRERFRNDEAVLEGLQPHPNLKSLTIEEFSGEKFPTWMMNMAVSINARGDLTRLDNLVNIKLTECSRCEVIPMLGHLPLLRELELSVMQNLKCISASFYCDQYDLYSNGSTSSTYFGDDKMTAVFPALISFHLRNMPNLVEWVEAPVIPDAEATTELSVAVFPRLAVLTIRDCPKLTTAPVNFPSLEKLWIKNCPELTTGVSHFPYVKELEIDGVENGSALAKISNLTTLTVLRIIEAPVLNSLPDGLLHNNRNLTELKIEKCPLLRHVVNLGVEDGCNSSLRSLDISFCQSLNMLPDGLHTLKSLEKLEVNSCPSLKSIPSLQGLRSLRHVSLRCEGLIYLPSTLLDSCVSLEEFRISACPYLISFPSLQSCTFLSSLEIIDCKKLNCLPEGLWCLTRLKTLRIGPFSEELNSFPSLEGLQHLQLSLKRVELRGWDHWDSIPEQLQHLIALEELSIHGFGMMEVMPEWFGNFLSLKDLKLRGCRKLKHFPRTEALACLVNLKRIWILKCGNLCQPNWSKIPNINPAIIIEDRWEWY